MNPLDAKELGIEDGDYVFIDNDPADRPYRNAKAGSPEHKTARLLCRARYYWAPPGRDAHVVQHVRRHSAA